ncbi:MAG: DNA repair protein RecN (Recombination protein N) [Gammaproteobacteria bacterium]|jgi:DNA repair protein RecN (Recombination protein N)
MLKQLHIQNLAIIDALDLDFDQGMTVLTGETGAGKSILIDALGLILGDRGDSSIIRQGCEKSEIVAIFNISGLKKLNSLLEHQSISIEENEIIIRRIIGRDGRSRAYINSSQVTIMLLREVGEHLIEIHGQHAHQSLIKRTVQRTLLDCHASHSALLDSVYQSYQTWKTITQQLAETGNDAESHSSTIDLLQYQVRELEELDLVADEYNELEEEYKRLSNVTQLISVSNKVLDILSDNDSSSESSLRRGIHELNELQNSDPITKNFIESLDNVSIQLGDTINEIRRYSDKLEDNPERLNEVDNRLNILQNMARKHHIHARELPHHLLQLQDKLEQLINSNDSVEKLIEQQRNANENYNIAAEKLHKSRVKASTTMAKEITNQLKQLGMPEGKFIVDVIKQDSQHPLEEGQDQVEFLVSLNPGSSPNSIRKVASGGELSRISLAIQMISRDAKLTPSLIFDEVDAGIGGKTADIVGSLLKNLAEKQQVLCVTHLPQVASRGDNHFQVSKYSKDKLTYTNINLLDKKSRIDEIARMLGGMRISKKTLEHAKEMLGQEETVN